MWIKGKWIKQTYELVCPYCSKEHTSTHAGARFCSPQCKSIYNENNFKERHKDSLEQVFRQLLKGRPDRKELSVEFLLELFEKQEGKCALSGEPMTWGLRRGKQLDAVSIDQIIPSAGYTHENTQLVCNIVNSMKLNLTPEQLKFWAGKLA